MVTLGFRTQIVHTRATSPLSSTLAAASSYQSPESRHLPNTQNLGSTVVFPIPRTATSLAATTGATYVPPRLPMLLTVMVLRPVRGGDFAARTRDWRRVISAAMPKLDLEATYLMVRMSMPQGVSMAMPMLFLSRMVSFVGEEGLGQFKLLFTKFSAANAASHMSCPGEQLSRYS